MNNRIGYRVSKALLGVIVLLIAVPALQASETVGTFQDPSGGGSDPVFSISPGQLIGGWDDSKTGLTLEFPFLPSTFTDVFFTMDPIAYTGGLQGGTTGPGNIKFFEDNANTNIDDPIFVIDFDSAILSAFGFGGNSFFGNNVTLSGSQINGSLTDEASFSFGFGNMRHVGDGIYTATAAFTSSAVVPEPVSLALLAMGAGILRLKRKRGRPVA
jgi:hypothetical protein